MILVIDDHKDNFYSHVQVSYINFNLICHYLKLCSFFLWSISQSKGEVSSSYCPV